MKVLSRFRRVPPSAPAPPGVSLQDKCAVLTCERHYTRIVKGVRLCDRCGPLAPGDGAAV